MKTYKLIYLLLFVAFFTACKKDGVRELETESLDSGAQIKFHNFGVNAPSMNFYAADSKISAVVSLTGAEAPGGITYGSIFPIANYSFINAGAYTLSGKTPDNATITPGITVATFPGTLDAGKFYSFFTCGFYNVTTQTTDAFLIEDQIPVQNETQAYVRFVNTISNAPNGFDLVIRNTTSLAEIAVARNVGYKATSPFVLVPNGVYEVFARYTNGNTNIISRTGTSVVSLIAGRTFTISSRGDMTVTGATAVNRPFLDNTSNRP